ncbi:hypothetical protein AALP_AA4G263700 [Arabis alpina]|uniref:Uncharacterized protein n=1 Tax=Arabis alpina TaxID=50452 RepID=A0A087H5T5_ARAAL|nr:hypothetical protein AALP_AA4G263700 [Arabis alpina]
MLVLIVQVLGFVGFAALVYLASSVVYLVVWSFIYGLVV